MRASIGIKGYVWFEFIYLFIFVSICTFKIQFMQLTDREEVGGVVVAECGVAFCTGKTEENQENRSPFRGVNTGSSDYVTGLLPTLTRL